MTSRNRSITHCVHALDRSRIVQLHSVIIDDAKLDSQTEIHWQYAEGFALLVLHYWGTYSTASPHSCLGTLRPNWSSHSEQLLNLSTEKHKRRCRLDLHDIVRSLVCACVHILAINSFIVWPYYAYTCTLQPSLDYVHGDIRTIFFLLSVWFPRRRQSKLTRVSLLVKTSLRDKIWSSLPNYTSPV